MRSRIALAIAVASALCVITTSAHAAADIFLRDLKVGDSGPDVLALQKLLNATLRVPIAQSGPGSRGNESVYFGPKTKAAAVSFQEKNASEILVPAGLHYGSGFVGARTRVVLNRMWNELSVKASGVSQGGVHLYSLSPETGTFGSTVTLKGAGFTKSNTIVTGYDDVQGMISADGSTLTLTLPRAIPGINFTKEQVAGVDATLPFWVSVKNENGQSEALLFTFSPF